MTPKTLLFRLCSLLLAGWMAAAATAAETPVLRDDAGQPIHLEGVSARVVSLTPSVTEVIYAIGAGDRLVGCTYHSQSKSQDHAPEVIGGFFAPHWQRIADLRPDLVFYHPLQADGLDQLACSGCQTVMLKMDTLESSFAAMRKVGRIFDRPGRAEALLDRIQAQLATVAAKVDRIPQAERLRVVRFMGRDRVMAPGDDSFQNELIRAAGGIAPRFDKTGPLVAVSLKDWQTFNPQVVYGCQSDRLAADTLLNRPGWKDVDAVKNDRIHFFPCDLTCRVSSHTGDFVGWLSARLYADAYGRPQNRVLPETVAAKRNLAVELGYVQSARILTSHIHDFVNKTLVVAFDEPQVVISTLEGRRTGIRAVGNHYASPPTWLIAHGKGFENLRERVLKVAGQREENTCLLFTGADLDNLALVEKHHRDLKVIALVTAGVRSNAVRLSKDTGHYYEPGTINTIILTNTRLSERAMQRAVITATEAKTAALLDLDIRSSYRPERYRATGTGTDNMIVVQGRGLPIELTGGHTKMGELIAAAVYDGVRQAVAKQNGIGLRRSLLHRFDERQLDPVSLARTIGCDCPDPIMPVAEALQHLMLEPRMAGFIQSALAISDDYEKGLVQDLDAYRRWCRFIAEDIAGCRPVPLKSDFTADNALPLVLQMMFDALLSGLEAKAACHSGGLPQ